MPMHDIDLPAGYSIAKAGVSGVPPNTRCCAAAAATSSSSACATTERRRRSWPSATTTGVQAERAAARNRRPGPDRAVRR
jgi:phage protein D